jgi:hypothetical protein
MTRASFFVVDPVPGTRYPTLRSMVQNGADHKRIKYCPGNRFTVETDMIAFLYPKEDWTAAEIALKIQAVAASQDIEVYSVPKFQKNRKELIFQRLSKTSQAIFLAYDVKSIDEDTQDHLMFLKEKKKPVYFIIPKDMENTVGALGFAQNIRLYDPADKMAIIPITESLLEDLKNDANREGMAVFIVLVGILLMILFLVLSTSKE